MAATKWLVFKLGDLGTDSLHSFNIDGAVKLFTDPLALRMSLEYYLELLSGFEVDTECFQVEQVSVTTRSYGPTAVHVTSSQPARSLKQEG